MTKQEKVKYLITYFQKHNPEAKTELHYKTAYELIVAVILSAQCTDVRVNKITPHLLKKYPTVNDMAKGTQNDVFEIIKSCSYPNNKASHLIGMSRMVVNDFNGQIPDNRNDLEKLPGVGRKTANVILPVAFNKQTMAVDTHVFRVSARLGLSSEAKTPFETEQALVTLLPKNLLSKAHHWLILHGRYVCKAKNPKCENCGIKKYCNYYLSVNH